MVLWDRDGDGANDTFDWYCSGTMVDDDTYLTAAHCTTGWTPGARFFISLDEDVETRLAQVREDGVSGDDALAEFVDDRSVVEGTPHQDPAYPGNASDSHDIAVLELDDEN